MSLYSFFRQKYISFIRQFRLLLMFGDIRLALGTDIRIIPPKTTKFVHHGLGVVIGKDVVLGENVIIFQHVTIGEKHPIGEHKRDVHGSVNIGDDVTIYTGATVLGNITVGEESIIGAHALVIDDVPPYSIARGVPAKAERLQESLARNQA